MIKINHLTKSFDGIKVLDDLNLDIAEHEILAILGESGTGKSVLLKHLIGLLKPDTGSIEIEGTDITSLSERKLLPIRKMIGYLFQEGALYDFMNVKENLAFPLKEHTSLSRQEIEEKVEYTLRIVDLKGIGNKFPSELSGGMRKRVGLARSIILDSKVLLCDEPTSGLDPIRSKDISDLIMNVTRQTHCTTIITSHDVRNSFRIADRVALLRHGKFIAVGSPEELKNNTDPFIKAFFD